ncbi:DsrE family protein [Thiohalophilus thiocyanatoxydans]|nr:DsrE family protein [Thiohalophilus thiocyanatoxydans]
MRVPSFWIVMTLLAVSVWLIPASQAQAEEKKVVYHADFSDPRRFSAMLTSINNMITTYKSDLVEYDIRIVFVAHGIRFVTDNDLQDTPFEAGEALRERRADLSGRLQSLVDVHDVKLELCNITRAEIDLDKDELYEGVEMVQSGVVRIAELQEDDFAYLKIE